MYKGIEIVRIAPLELILWHTGFRCERAESIRQEQHARENERTKRKKGKEKFMQQR